MVIARKLIIVLSAACLILCDFSASAWADTGNDLLQWCGAGPFQFQKATFETGRCMGYIEGAAQVMQIMDDYLRQTRHGQDSDKLCIPDQTPIPQIIDVVIKFLIENPEKRNERDLVIISEALRKGFPCPKSP